MHSEYCWLGWSEHGVETVENDHGQDHVAVLATDIDVAQDVISDAPKEVGNPMNVLIGTHMNSLSASRAAGNFYNKSHSKFRNLLMLHYRVFNLCRLQDVITGVFDFIIRNHHQADLPQLYYPRSQLHFGDEEIPRP